MDFACGAVTTDSDCYVSNPDALVPQVAYEQRVHFYTTVFYFQNAPPDFTGLPG